MSFTSNPFKNIEIHSYPEGNVGWICSSCGAESNNRRNPGLNRDWDIFTPVGRLIQSFHAHLKDSHQITPEELAAKNWSDF